jgi:cellulose biosynthesis protein BcsQ
VVGIASPKGGAGKTTLALNLSVSLARQGRQVILVDASLNADVLGAINALDRERAGVHEVIAGSVPLEQALLPTTIATLRILPSMGLPEVVAAEAEQAGRWRNLLSSLSAQAPLVIVDTPPGMYGITQHVLGGCTDVIGVLQCETLAQRTFPTFWKALARIPDAHRPRVLGVFLNMLQPAHPASVAALRDVGAQFPASAHLFDTAMPRNPAFLSATENGVPLRLMDESNPPAVTWLFEALAAEVVDRLGLPVEHRPQRLLA